MAVGSCYFTYTILNRLIKQREPPWLYFTPSCMLEREILPTSDICRLLPTIYKILSNFLLSRLIPYA